MEIRTEIANIFHSKHKFNHFILQITVHSFHAYFPYQCRRLTNNHPMINWMISVDTFDMPNVEHIC